MLFYISGYPQELVISQNFSGHIVTHTDWPSILRNKGVFFVKREPEPLPKENFLNFMTCGDIHPNALGKTFLILNFEIQTPK